jgi:hypothetical protein
MKGERGVGSGAGIGVTDFSVTRQPPNGQEDMHSDGQQLEEPGPPSISNDGFGSQAQSQEFSGDRVAEQETHSEFSPEFS